VLKHRDIVQIITTKKIRYVSGPPGQATNPNGNWTIVGFSGVEAIIAKESTLVKVPIQDIRKIASFNIDTFYKQLEMAGFEKPVEINMPEYISTTTDISIVEARLWLKKHNYKLTVDSESERDKILERIVEARKHG